MTRDHLTAIRKGIPFVIRMADGEKYEVVDQHKVAVGQANMVVVGADDIAHILPMLTMTGISYLESRK